MPKKPTQPFGAMIFSKNGKVKPDTKKLSEDRTEQEKGAINIIADQFRRMGRPIIDVKQLPESDHDFEASCDGKRVIIQLAELVSRNFHDPDTFILDTAAEAAALTNVISGKLNKHYARPNGSEFWLVIFSTYPYATEYWQGGVRKVSEGLMNVRKMLTGCTDNSFDEIWFSNLQTNPVKIFPVES